MKEDEEIKLKEVTRALKKHGLEAIKNEDGLLRIGKIDEPFNIYRSACLLLSAPPKPDEHRFSACGLASSVWRPRVLTIFHDFISSGSCRTSKISTMRMNGLAIK